MISIICVYNDRDAFEMDLLKSLKEQTVEFELIEVDNQDDNFFSAASALNFGASQATGEFLMFAHQDICLESENWLERAEKMMGELDGVGAVGVAGRKEGGKTNSASVEHGVPRNFVGNQILTSPVQVQTLDECLIVTSRDIFSRYQFDEIVCDDWHLYGVDYCLRLKKDFYNNYVLPLPTYHRSLGRSIASIFEILISLGSLPPGYITTIEKILKKHKGTFRQVFTTCGNWRTNWPVFPQRVINIPKDVARYSLWFWRQTLHNFQDRG